MKLTLKHALLTLCVISLGLFQSCKDDECPCQDETNPACENYNPCWNRKRVSADFVISNILTINTPDWWEDELNPDIAFARGKVAFKAIESSKNAKYTWKLGTETISGRSFVRNFNNTIQTKENDIPITLIIEKEPDPDCFHNDDGKDTITRYIHFIESPCDYLTNGDFKVLFEGENDSVVVGIRNWYQPSSGSGKKITDSCSFYQIRFIGFDHDQSPQDTTWDTGGGVQFNSKIILGKSTGGGALFYAYNGSIIINPQNLVVEAEYEILTREELKKYKFKGRKIK